MELKRAIRLSPGNSAAFVGAGGKTAAISCLARSMESPVVVTTTTHLGAWQCDFADYHQVVQSGQSIERLDFTIGNVLLVTGPLGKDDRFTGLEKGILDRLHHLCQQDHLPLLIEADGARQRYLKAPADYEPVIPDWVDQVIVIAGLAGLHKPLDSNVVHRPEIFSELSGLQIGDLIGADEVVSVLRSDRGGLKGIPKGSTRILFLNQADDILLQSQGQQISRQMVNYFDQVLIGSIQQPRSDRPIFSVQARTAGVILAAGGSERLGRPKQLLDWQGVPFVVQVAQNALASGLKPLVVVTGADHEEVQKALEGLPVRCVYNPDWGAGQSTSMIAGLSALPEACDSAMFLLSDQPQIPVILIQQLIERYAQNRAPITAPMVNDRQGNPVLFAQETFDALRQVSGDQGGRAIFNQFTVDWLPWLDDRILLDVDEAGDADTLRDAYFPTKS